MCYVKNSNQINTFILNKNLILPNTYTLLPRHCSSMIIILSQILINNLMNSWIVISLLIINLHGPVDTYRPDRLVLTQAAVKHNVGDDPRSSCSGEFNLYM